MYLWGVWGCNETQHAKMYVCSEALFKKENLRGIFDWAIQQKFKKMTLGKLNTYVLIGHVPVRPLSVGHDFPHDDPIAPHITSRGELPVLDSFGCSPSDRNLPSLRTQRAQHQRRKRDRNPTVTVSWLRRETLFTATMPTVIQTGRWIQQNPRE